MSRCLGLDWGEKRTGVAVSDDRHRLAVGYAVWPTRELFTRLTSVVPQEEIGLIVIGYPLTLRGEVGTKAKQVDRVVRELERQGYAVCRWDERYTTSEASRALSQIGVSQRRQRGTIDMSAAVLMLQSYLDAKSPREGESGG